MKRWTLILIAVIILLIILIVIFNNYGSPTAVDNYSNMETQMRKLWY